ncbi:4-hydroxythreonine-4-phosphate dehydrogenase PdxA [Tistrella mobilis]|uniref:4-hydroxythreonine-4-phosphate dehydrogenase PdxA n=1 Tax=Tistrella mobilis TaxID=171437 RepID=UPI0031F65D7C
MSASDDAPRRPLAVTMGEPAGIGGELTLAAWMRRADLALPAFLALDDPDRLAGIARKLGWQVPIREIASASDALTAFDDALPVLPVRLPSPATPGRPDPAHAGAVVEALDHAVDLAMAGAVDGVVTNPIQKKTLYDAGFPYPGHTEYLAARCGGGMRPVMMIASPAIRVVPVTIHEALVRAVALLTPDLIVETATITAEALHRDFGIARPRLALAGVNPHAGEDGTLGREDIEIVAPAIERLKAAGIDARGPLPADTLFHEEARAGYDAVLGMYHDQVLIPAKTLDFHGGVNVTLGLPIVRTSPDHGTALDLAGRGTARVDSLTAAIRLAGTMAAARARISPSA